MVSCFSFFHEFKAFDFFEARPVRGAFVSKIKVKRTGLKTRRYRVKFKGDRLRRRPLQILYTVSVS